VKPAPNIKTIKTLIFHIGLEKTGTTSFQKFSTVYRADFLRCSVLYPTNNYAFSKYNHSPLVACYFHEDGTNLLIAKSSRRSREDVLASLNREIAGTRADKVLISAEHFSSRFSPTQIQQLATDFSGYHCKIVVVVRDHISRALSAYNTTIISGRHLTLHEYVDELCRPTNLYIRYKETIRLWEAVFGAENIIVIAHADNSNIVEALTRTIVSPEFKFRGNESFSENKSLGASTIEAHRLINKQLSEYRQAGASKFPCQYYLEIIRYAIRKKALKASPDRLQISENDLQRLEAIAEIDRQWLEEHYNVILTNL
jgi:hypothetical protein